MLVIRKILTFTIVGLLIVPQITFAAWWNPLTWKIFNRARAPQIEVQKTEQSSEIEKLRSEIEKLKKNTSPFSPKEDSILKIERCKLEAKQYAEPIANRAQKETYDSLVANLKYPNASKYNLQPYSNPQTIGEVKNNLENLKTLMDSYNRDVDVYNQGLQLSITISKKAHDDTYEVYYNKYYSSCLQ